MERDNRGGRRFNDRSRGERHSGGGGGRFGNRSFGNRSFNQAPREMHKATCSECKQECEVPFKPSGERPVYCRDCFRKKRD